jgi:hypothetical protein
VTPRTVVIRGDGTNVLSFTIPSNVDFNVESVVASVDASGAGDTIGELAIAEVTGEVIATKRQSEPIPAGDTGLETWALRLTDEGAGAAAGFPNLPYAVASGNGTIANGGMALTLPDLPNFDTNESGLFVHDSTGSVGHSGGILIEGAGRYLALARAHFIVPGGGGPEPAASQMFATWDAYNYNGSESDWAINHTIATGFPGFPQQPWLTVLVWDAWNIDQQDIGAAFVGPPFSEYHVALYNNGTQSMSFDAAIMVLRIGDSDGL